MPVFDTLPVVVAKPKRWVSQSTLAKGCSTFDVDGVGLQINPGRMHQGKVDHLVGGWNIEVDPDRETAGAVF